MEKNTIIMVVLVVLILISAVQAIQLGVMKNKVEEAGGLKLGSSSGKVASQSGGSDDPIGGQGLDSLPSMVGGC